MPNPFMPSVLFYPSSLNRSISSTRDVWLVFIYSVFYRNSRGFNANSVDPDQTQHSAASDLGLHVLLMSLFGDTWHE